MTAPLRLGLAGLGTVGAGVVRLLAEEAGRIALRAGRPIRISAVSARDRGRDRGLDLSGLAWESDPVALAARPDVDVLVEVIGGEDGPARAAFETALRAGKDVVTANKALLAHHGQALAELAEAHGATIRYEAAVAGAIPVIKALAEGLAANRINRVMGVMNGTCNYILTRMESAGLPYEVVFEEARALGYLEADPRLDVDGIDAGHKLALLAALAFGTRVDFAGVTLEGIGRVAIEDIRHAAELGYRIKLLGVAQMTGRGLEQRMNPCLVPAQSPLGQLEGGTNMVVLEGAAAGQIVLRGPGAGAGPTASAVMADVIDLARGNRPPVFGQPAASLHPEPAARVGTPASHYLRLMLVDRPGALAKVAVALGDSGISIDRMRQRAPAAGVAPVLIVTHPCARTDLDLAMASVADSGVLVGAPVALRIEAV
jgi:homoserine dehydrogenase